MRTTYLVQRLNVKPSNDFAKKAPRAFGGGMLLLKDQAWDLLQEYFNIHYMGAAEYEFGTLGRTLGEILHDRAELVTFDMVLQREDVKVNYQHEWNHQMQRRRELEAAHKAGVKAKRAKPFKDPGFTPKRVYVLCRKAHQTRVTETIRELALAHRPTKGCHGFDFALDPVSDFDREAVGWLELDNGFFFFTDKTAFEGTCRLFLTDAGA